MTLEQKRLEMELLKVKAARAELEYRVIEREEDIKRIKEHIQIQIQKEQEIQSKINK